MVLSTTSGSSQERRPRVSAKKPAPAHAGSSAAKPRGRPFEPGNTHAWKPGQSGNPSGLPKNRIETAAYIEQRLREEYLEQLVTALALHAIKGSPTHIVEALNRIAGKVIDKAEISHGLAALGIVVLPPEDK